MKMKIFLLVGAGALALWWYGRNKANTLGLEIGEGTVTKVN